MRARFDAHNLVWLPLLLLFFLVVSLFELGMSIGMGSTARVLNAGLTFTLAVFGLMIMRDIYRADRNAGIRGPADFVQRHVGAFVAGYCIVQFLLAVLFTRQNWIGWAILFPLMLIGFRLLVSELIIIHSFFLAIVFVHALTGPPRRELLPMLISSVVVNLLVMGVSVLIARRLRGEIITDWTQRRVHAREQIRMRDELQYARELQLSMLPDEAPRLPWLDVAGISVPASEVGGDYYDYFMVGDCIALVSGDVAGHGMASGIVLSSLRSGFILLQEQLDAPAVVLERLHALVARASRRRVLATAAVLLLDPKNRTATLASAGHPPLLFRRNGAVETLDVPALPLGVRLALEVGHRELDLRDGDLFVLHTDGIYETRNADDEVYGLERLATLVATHDGDAAALRDAIIRDVEEFRGAAEQLDDVTLVVARIRA